jgi:hypothetical protein
MRCDQCEALMINGLLCHETGCLNSRKVYRDGQWVKVFECRECGYEVEQGEACNCMEPIEEEREEEELERSAPSWMQRTDE